MLVMSLHLRVVVGFDGVTFMQLLSAYIPGTK